MSYTTQIVVPSLVRIKPGALGRLGLYCHRPDFREITLFISPGIEHITGIARQSLAQYGVRILNEVAVTDATYETASACFTRLTNLGQACVGIGGGKALDVARYVAFLGGKPFFSVPTALSNDSFCSPQSSLTIEGKRRSLPSKMPYAVVVDTNVCLQCPDAIWFSGIGDLVAKVTAIADWKLAYHATNTDVNDLAAELSLATVYQFAAAPHRNHEGMRLLATALMLSGVAMEICGNSRPASGSEHLISHALDAVAKTPRPHGLQVGTATYLCALLQGAGTEQINNILNPTGFWQHVHQQPFAMNDWIQALEIAPTIKQDFYTVLSTAGVVEKAIHHLQTDPYLKPCFTR